MPDFSGDINKAADQYGVPKPLLYNLIGAESSFDPNAINPLSGAAGLGQFLPSTAKDVGLTNPLDPTANINAAARYLAHLEQQTGSWGGALKAYGGGLSGYQHEAEKGNKYAGNLLAMTGGNNLTAPPSGPGQGQMGPAPQFTPVSAPAGEESQPQQVTINMPGSSGVPGQASMNPLAIWSILQGMLSKTHQFTPVDYDPWAIVKGREAKGGSTLS